MNHVLSWLPIFIPIFIWIPAIVLAEWVQDEQPIMGTVVRAEVWHPDIAVAQAAVGAVMGEMRRIDRLMSPYRPNSELALINSHAAQRSVHVSEELHVLIKRSLQISCLTEGAFDITFASIGYLYDYRNRIRPQDKAVQNRLPSVDFRHVKVDAHDGTLSFAHSGVKIDLGGIAKGHAVDNALEILKRQGIHHALVSAGGDTGILGNRNGRPWVVAVRDPRHPDAVVAMLPMYDVALSTSGDYERYFEQDGVRYHHILNPGTGKSAGELRSVSILGPDVTTTDALSTSVFVLGLEKGMALVGKLRRIEAVIVDREGMVYFSTGLTSISHTSPAEGP